MEDKKISGVEPRKSLAGTPPSTPIPQAASTAAHRPEESLNEEMNVEEEDYETRLSDIIGGLRFLGSKLQDRESQISQEQSQMSEERAIVRSESSSSLGILKFDEMQSFSGITLDEDIHNLMQNFEAALASAKAKESSEDICVDESTDRKLVSENQDDKSDLAIDLRVRLQKELAQRTMERFSLPETPRSKSGSISVANKSFQEGCTASRETFTISKWPKEQSLNSGPDLVKSEEDANDPYSFLNEAKCSSSFVTGDKMVQLGEYSNENFVPGEQCEELLVCDEEVWSEQNVPPVVGHPVNPSTSQLEFSGVAANAEITLPNVSKYLGNLNSKVSIGQYFRLKSEDPDTLTDRCSVMFPTNQRLKEKDRDSINSTLSLTQIAGILGKLDSAMSPTTLVANFLKQASSSKSHSASMNQIPKITYYDNKPNNFVESEEPGWMFDVPRKNEGLGSRAYSIVANNSPQKESAPVAQRTITIEDSLAAGDLSVVKLDETADESVVSLTKELISKPKESIDCSALLPTLKKHCRGIWPDDQSEFIDAEAFSLPRSPSSMSRVLLQDGDTEMAWANAVCPYPPPYICVGVPYDIVLPIQNLTARWLICGLTLVDIKLPEGEPDSENLAIVKIPPKTVLMDPNNKKEAKIEVVPVCANLVEIGLEINLEDVVTKATQKLWITISIIGEEPNLSALFDREIKKPTNDHELPLVDLGALPEECMDQITITMFNRGKAPVPLRLRTQTQIPSGFEIFFLLPEEEFDYDNRDWYSDTINGRKLILHIEIPPETEYKIIMLCATPTVKLFTDKKNLCEMCGFLTITLMSITPLDLQEFQLSGLFGTTKLALQVASQPLRLTSTGLGRSEIHRFPLKNCGVVSFVLAFRILDAEERCLPEDDFTVKPSSLMLECGHTDEVIITYTPSSLQQAPLYRILFIQMHPLGPQYYIELLGTIAKPTVERKAISPVELHNKIQSLNDSLSSTAEKSRELKQTAKQPQKEKDKISGSPLLSRSCISQNTRRSSGSNSDSAACEKLRIQSTRRELVWGSVDVGKTVMRSCSIRSLSEHRCRIQISITDRNNVYKLLNEKGELVTQRKTMLHSNELLVLNVMFNPSKTGPLPAKLTFTHLPGHSEDTSSVHIPLYGCGGHARLIVKGIPRDGAARLWLTLQQQDSEEELFWESKFSVRNLGDLPAFFKVGVVSKGFHHVHEGSFIVEPSELVIPRGSTEDIQVFCRPRPQDLKLLLSGQFQDVIEVATINLISGDESTRHRLRRLHKKMMKQNAAHKEKYTEIDLAAITAPFPGEKSIAKLDSLKESLENIHELYHCVSLQEVIVLLENNNDRTIQEGDTSRVFHSLYEVDISRTRIEETTCYNAQEETLFTDIAKSPAKCTWHIDPTSLTITPPVNICAVFHLKTDSSRKQPFETGIPAHPPGWILSVNPSTGFIPASDELVLVVSCSPSNESSSSRPLCWKGNIQVFIENDLKEVKVVVLSNPRAKQDQRPVNQPKNKLATSSPSKTSNRPHTAPAAASQSGTLRRTENLLQKPSEQPQKRSPTKTSRIPVPSLAIAPVGSYPMSDWTEEHEKQGYKPPMDQLNASFLQPFSKNVKKSPNSKR